MGRNTGDADLGRHLARLLDGIDWIPGVDDGRGEFVFHASLNFSMLRWSGDGDG
jgi:hypothetical protein